MSAARKQTHRERVAEVWRPDAMINGARVHWSPRMKCLRCGSAGFISVGHTDALWEDVVLCVESCAKRDWLPCLKCNGARVPDHVGHCPVGHPGHRERREAQLGFNRSLVGALLAELSALGVVEVTP